MYQLQDYTHRINYAKEKTVHNLLITYVDHGGDNDYNDDTDMEVLHTTKIVRTGTSLGLIIPKAVLKAYGWERGDSLIFAFSPDNYLLVKRPSDTELKELRKITQSGDERIKMDGTTVKEINV